MHKSESYHLLCSETVLVCLNDCLTSAMCFHSLFCPHLFCHQAKGKWHAASGEEQSETGWWLWWGQGLVQISQSRSHLEDRRPILQNLVLSPLQLIYLALCLLVFGWERAGSCDGWSFDDGQGPSPGQCTWREKTQSQCGRVGSKARYILKAEKSNLNNFLWLFKLHNWTMRICWDQISFSEFANMNCCFLDTVCLVFWCICFTDEWWRNKMRFEKLIKNL